MKYKSHWGQVLTWGDGNPNSEIPNECYWEADSTCTHGQISAVEGFQDHQGAVAWMKSNTDIQASASATVFPGVTIAASLDVAISKSSSGSYFANSAGAFGQTVNTRKCHAIKYECIAGGREGVDPMGLTSDFLERLQAQPIDVTGTS